MRVLSAASVYFAIAFAAGFALGACRVLLLEKLVGPTVAVLIEAPFMLAISGAAARMVCRRWLPSSPTSHRLGAGVIAFSLLQEAELAIAPLVSPGVTPWFNAYVSRLETRPGALGLALQVVFALLPAIIGPGRPRPISPAARGAHGPDGSRH